MKRIPALTAAFGLTATIVFLPGGAGAADHGTLAAPGADTPAPVPAPALASDRPAAATEHLPAAPSPEIVIAAIPASPAALPVPVPAPAAALLAPAAPAADDHMAQLCAAREVFCHVDSSGRYTGS